MSGARSLAGPSARRGWDTLPPSSVCGRVFADGKWHRALWCPNPASGSARGADRLIVSDALAAADRHPCLSRHYDGVLVIEVCHYRRAGRVIGRLVQGDEMKFCWDGGWAPRRVSARSRRAALRRGMARWRHILRRKP